MDENNNTTTSAPEGVGASSGGENKKIGAKLIIILIVIVVLGAVYMLVRKGAEKGDIGEGAKTEQPAPVASEPTAPPAEAVPAEEAAAGQGVVFTENGYEPNEVTVKKGEAVTFVNATATPTWPASAQHPDHKVYPGSDIAKCDTLEASTIFDACKGLAEGESWAFTFNEVGTWNYHDHLNPTKFGKIIVTE